MTQPSKPLKRSTDSTNNPSAAKLSGSDTRRSQSSQRFPAALRIKRNSDFASIFGRGKVAVDECLVVHAVYDPDQATQLGLSVSKKVGGAPQRNRWKRLIREAFRRNYQSLPENFRIVIRPRKGARPDYHAIEQSLIRLCKRLASPGRGQSSNRS